jgi:hypothetical protein
MFHRVLTIASVALSLGFAPAEKPKPMTPAHRVEDRENRLHPPRPNRIGSFSPIRVTRDAKVSTFLPVPPPIRCQVDVNPNGKNELT